ncbi:YueI family protein [Bacillus sp. FJAT-45350]|uniref:YueI family protein n=1 Tax=Bacillus sp. FJAT-45350 TaxID=2011014 RepID=UPI000BB8BCB2|nr:YueI family protein [Bacillus sp. FJAT-45350]
MSNKVNEILERGIYGTPETLPEERNIFLSTIVERIYLALTKKQVIHKGMYDEAVRFLNNKKDIRLFINGNLSYHLYSNYVKEANKNNVPFTVVNDQNNSPFGLVIASDRTAVNHSDIYIKDDYFHREMNELK